MGNILPDRRSGPPQEQSELRMLLYVLIQGRSLLILETPLGACYPRKAICVAREVWDEPAVAAEGKGENV